MAGADQSVTIFMYHDVRDPAQSRWPDRYRQRSFVSPAKFDADLELIGKRYHVISLRRALAGLSDEADLPANAAVLTFDDGLRDHADAVLPILTARKMRGCFFVAARSIMDGQVMHAHKIQFILAATAALDRLIADIAEMLAGLREENAEIPSFDDLWRSYSRSLVTDNHWSPEQVFVTRLLRGGLDASILHRIVNTLFAEKVTADEKAFAADLYLSPAQVGALAACGMDLGGHGTDSKNLCQLSEEERLAEINGARQLLECLVPAYVRSGSLAYAYPHGGHDDHVRRLMPQCGFAAGLSTEKRAAVASDDRFNLPRFDGAQDRPWEG
ncbi:hypothetical protein CU669_08955 [Paramagnetospirillum kuznetsovii]|uniref:Chitooligosaccharide deacetylase n=1 Tax=Paramagnetospirillum kuznetsovii TaxID=2053833 RepID=A0A364NZC1_9PROT|nr:polysaccharide deacetylase family protein [Paramagnetospirillum kuznetsovii]RAU22245.1 hypothetical protein CU669_08955 [Paramagnetospirillum kuznetsovii]